MNLADEGLALLGAVALFLSAVVCTWKWLGLGNFLAAIRNFLEDWSGDPPRPGYPGRPSFPERLSAIEKEFRPNGGGSLRDLANLAKLRSEEAADTAAELTAILGKADHIGKVQREELKALVLGLAAALEDFARDTRRREQRYVEKAAELGFDLSGVTEDLND